MAASRRTFLKVTAGAAAAGALRASQGGQLDGSAIARRHRIAREMATPNFFEGMLLGNGDIGLCVTVRPDALGIHIGKSDSWDIRVSEDHYGSVLSFADLLKLWERAGEEAKREGHPDMIYLEREIPFFCEYTKKVASSYAKSWPRPWPCGILWVHWDATRYAVKRQTLDPSNGHYLLELRDGARTVNVRMFVNTTEGNFCVWSDEPLAVLSIAYYPNLDEKAQLPPPELDGHAGTDRTGFAAYQLFPASAPTQAVPNPPPSDKDRNFALHAYVKGRWHIEDLPEVQTQLREKSAAHTNTYTSYAQAPGVFLKPANAMLLRIDVALATPRDHADSVSYAREVADRHSRLKPEDIQRKSDAYWDDYWSRSAVQFEDRDLERTWYHNQYWLACCLREGKIAPGLFGNWTSGAIGTAWHGDYHMNYNTQQVFWGVFSSNHAEQHLPYLELVESLMDMSRNYARDKFGLPGAYFPHSAYPVPSQVVPYPAPPWGYEICETPWVVQSLWWHYLYTQDEQVLRRVFPPIREAARFIAAYVKRGTDGRYHVIPTVSPENWGCTVDFRLNKDCIMDLALTDFLMEAAIQGSTRLGENAEEREQWAAIRANLANYPKTAGGDGEIWVDVLNAPPGWIYNIPVTLAPVFPGERVGLDLKQEELDIARRTAETIRLEGGNDVVYQPLIRARLGMLDLDWFKKEVAYCQLPNGIVNDRVRQVGGRYKDSTDFDFMMRMGVWTENLSLPAVLNECLLQSYSGTLRVFPNTRNLGPASFRNLRAAGAFLVSAGWDGTTVSNVEILSERGAPVRFVHPWGTRAVSVLRARDQKAIPAQLLDSILRFDTEPGERYHLGIKHVGIKHA